MPRQRISYARDTYVFLADFPQRPKRFQEESGLPWAEIARRVGADIESVRCWREGRARPNAEHLAALQGVAEDMGQGSLLTDWTAQHET